MVSRHPRCGVRAPAHFFMTYKLLIVTSDKNTLKWESLPAKVRAIETVLNTIKNSKWQVEVQYKPLAPKVNNGRISHTWYNSISYPLFREGNQFVFLHFSRKQWDVWGMQSTLRGANQIDDDFVGESYGWADEDTKRGSGRFNQFIQVVLHEMWHELCRTTGVKDTLHDWHKENFDIATADWTIFDMNNWQPTYQEGMKEIGLWTKIRDLTAQLMSLRPKSNTARPQSLTPLVERKANDVLAEMKSLGHEMRIVEGFRSIERQNQLYAQGRTNPGSIVTNAKAGESFHNYGVAVDFVFRKEGYNATEQQWRLFGLVGKKHGFEWGGDWVGFIDRPHLEMRLGYTLSDFQNNRVDYSKYA